MKITHKLIREDVQRTIAILKTQEVEIPSSWQCMKPGIFIVLGLLVLQLFVVWPIIQNSQGLSRSFAAGSIYFTLFIGVFILALTFMFNSKYLSLPEDIRKEGVIIGLYRKKIKLFLAAWVFLNLSIAALSVVYTSGPFITSGFQLVSLILFIIAFFVDMSRYDLSLFSSAIEAWRNGDTPESGLVPKE